MIVVAKKKKATLARICLNVELLPGIVYETSKVNCIAWVRVIYNGMNLRAFQISSFYTANELIEFISVVFLEKRNIGDK